MIFQYSAKTTKIVIEPIATTALAQLGLTLPTAHTVAGFGEDEFLTIELADDDYTAISGADGYISRSALPNPLGTSTLTLMQNSPSNIILEALREADKLIVGAGLFKLSVTVPEFKNGAVVSGFGTGETLTATAWITKMADYNFGKETGERAWVLQVAEPKFGNSKLGAIIATIGSIAGAVQDGLNLETII